MASVSRLLPPAPPPAAPLHRTLSTRSHLAIPHLRYHAASSASASSGAAVLERGGRAAEVALREFVTLDELRAAVRLRVRTFCEYAVDSVGAEVIGPLSSLPCAALLDNETVLS